MPELKVQHKLDRRIRVWSAGCSSGEEAYSIAMVMHEAGVDRNWDAKLLATDLDTDMVARAKLGHYSYSEEKRQGISDQRLQQYFFIEDDSGNSPANTNTSTNTMRVKDNLKELIIFKQLNLLQHWPMRGPFDVIFCRNVIIYFDKETQRALFNNFANILVPGGYIFIGHSESLHNVSDRFESCGKTIYRKIH